MKHTKKLIGLFAVAFLLISLTSFGSAWYSTFDYRRSTDNAGDSNLIYPFTAEDPDGDGQTSTYYGLGGNSYIYYNNDGDFNFADDTDSQVFGASTFIDGAKNQQVTGSAPSGLVAYYPLDNDNAKDISGNGNDGTLNGGVTTGATGQVDGAYDFDGNDDYVDVPGLSDSAFDDEASITAWVRLDVATPSNNQKTGLYYFAGSGTENTHYPYTDGQAYFSTFRDNRIDGISLNNNVNRENWHLLTVTTEPGTDGWKLYQNTELVHTANGESSISIDETPYIGFNDEDYINGKIDDVRIYDRALSSAEIQAIYDSTKPTSGNDPTFGAEESLNAAPSISINKPTNQTYGTDSIDVDVNTSDPDGDTYTCDIKDDGTVIGSTSETSETYTDTLTKSDGGHSLSVDCDDGTTTSSDSVSYTVDTKVKTLNLVDPAEGSTHLKNNIPLNYIASDNLSSVDACWYSVDGGTNNTIAGCSNTTISLTEVGSHDLTLYVNDTVGNEDSETNSFNAYHTNEIRLEDSETSSSISDFEVLFDNGTTTTGGSTSDGVFEINTSEIPYGDTNLTLKSAGYDTKEDSIGTWNESSELNTSYSMDPAGFTFTVYDEKNPSNKLYFNSTFSNGTKSVEVESITSKSESGIDPLDFSFTDKWIVLNNITFTAYDPDGDTETEENYKIVAELTNLNGGVETYEQDIADAPNEDESWELSDMDDALYKEINFYIENTLDGTKDSDWDVTVKTQTNNKNGFSADYDQLKARGFPVGDVDITVENNDYKPRIYYTDINEFSKVNLDAYLLKNTDAVTQSIVVVDEQGEGVKNALITVQKYIDSSWKTISQKKSTGSGTNFFLNPETQYQLIVSKTGFTQATDKFYPKDFNEITVQLASPEEFGFETMWDHISYKLLPEGTSVPALVTNFNFSVYDTESNLGEIGLIISHNETILNQTSVTGTPSGASVDVDVNLTNYTFGEEIEAEWYFYYNSTRYNETRIYTVQPELQPEPYSIFKMMDTVKTAVGGAGVAIMSLFLTLIVATGLGSRLGGLGGGFAVLLMFGFFTYAGWLPWPILMLTVAGMIGLYLLKG